MRIALTGATGFVGGSLARALAGQGHEITALVRPTADRGRLDGLSLRWHVGDVTEPATLVGFLDGAEQVVHAAGMLGQAGVAEAAYRASTPAGRKTCSPPPRPSPVPPRVLHVSSPGVLGPISGPPAAEGAPRAPSNAYERSKAAAEAVAEAYAARGLPLVIARPEFIYGPGDTHVLGLFRAVQRGRFFYIGGGGCRCHPTYIDDAVRGPAARPGPGTHRGDLPSCRPAPGDLSRARRHAGRRPRRAPAAAFAAARRRLAGRLGAGTGGAGWRFCSAAEPQRGGLL